MVLTGLSEKRQITFFKKHLIFLCPLFFLALSGNLFAHINDEVAIRSIISLEDENISLTIKIDAGMLFGQYYLSDLDPDKNKVFEQAGIMNFSNFLTSGLKISLDGKPVELEFINAEFSSFQEFVAGLCTIVYEYKIAYPDDLDSSHTFFFENCLESEVAIYNLNVVADNDSDIVIVSEERNEVLQDLTNITFGKGLPISPLADSAPPSVLTEVSENSGETNSAVPDLAASEVSQPQLPLTGISESKTEFAGSARLIDRIKNGDFNPFVLFLLAVVIGFFHAFTPGHGKSLVGAYLVANRGSFVQAVGLGITVTITHTISIYILGGLASAAAYFFMPSRIIPVMTILTGGLIVFIGLWSGIRRLTGLETDHAHILPNLRVLKKDYINVLVDGSAVDSSEFLAIESEEDEFQRRMKAAGAEGLNICSPGCETHRLVPFRIAERQSIQLMKMAVETGAVDAVVSGRKRILNKVSKVRPDEKDYYYDPLESSEQAGNLLKHALGNFSERGEIIIPEDRLSWKKLIPMGIAGGAVPCPDALAILLISLATGRLALGLGVVFAFSAGLAAALVLIGVLIVFSGKLAAKTRHYKKIAGLLPYISALFLIGIGLYMILRSI